MTRLTPTSPRLVLALLGGLSLACETMIGPPGGAAGAGGPGGGGSAAAGSGDPGQAGSGGGGTTGAGGSVGAGGSTAGATPTGTGGGIAGSGGATPTGTGGGIAGNGGATAAGRGGGTAVAGRGGSGGGAGSGPAGRGGTGGSAGSAGATGAAGTTGASATEICARWKADRVDLSEGTCTGDVASCTPGDMGATARANALRLVNLYRWLAALPPVVTDPAKDAQDQACALLMRANNMISHEPPTTWTCYTQDGATAAGSSNVSSGRAVSSVDAYMIDNGNPTTIGHRRWILSNSLGPIGIGGTDRASCMWTLNGTGRAGKTWMAWPAAGIIPLQAVSRSGTTTDSTGWTVQSDNINLAGAQVSVTVDGAAQPVTVTELGANYGSRYAIRFNPIGWTTQAGKTYAVSVTNIPTTITYTVQIVDCP